MVGHTGVFDAAKAAVEAVDECVGRTVEAVLAKGGAAFITADHGNADKMLDEFSADDLFDLMFTASYAFEQDFTFDFEDYDEMQAFIDTNHDQLDNYKEEYPSVMNWIEAGMIC